MLRALPRIATASSRLQRLLATSSHRFTSTTADSTSSTTGKSFINDSSQRVVDDNDDVEPVELTEDPYKKDEKQCILCKHDVKLDYKNSRLLQQFVSTFSGRVYEQHVTGLCDKQYKALLKTIALSRKAGYMPILTKDPKYLRDPKLFDPMRPIRPHSYA